MVAVEASTVRKLAEVEAAKAVMQEGMEWSVMKWLGQKKKVRRMADLANAALVACETEVKNTWSEDLRRAYAGANGGLEPQIVAIARRVKGADEEARRAHDEAEAIFDAAERELSARLARDGCRAAIRSWQLHEHAIRGAEAARQEAAPAVRFDENSGTAPVSPQRAAMRGRS